jgi:hypothetical protein
MKLRPVASGWVRALFFAALALAVFLASRHLMARSTYAAKTFALTCIGIAAIPMIDEIRRRSRRPEHGLLHWEPMPADVTYERLGSPRQLAWPVALVLWILVPIGGLAAAVNYLIGVLAHDVPASMGGVVAAVTGTLAGLAGWMGLRTVAIWRIGSRLGRWPAWTDAPPATLRFAPFVAELRREPVYYYRGPRRTRVTPERPLGDPK